MPFREFPKRRQQVTRRELIIEAIGLLLLATCIYLAILGPKSIAEAAAVFAALLGLFLFVGICKTFGDLRQMRIVPIPKWIGPETYRSLPPAHVYLMDRRCGAALCRHFQPVVRLAAAAGTHAFDESTFTFGRNPVVAHFNAIELADGVAKTIAAAEREWDGQQWQLAVLEDLRAVHRVLLAAAEQNRPMHFCVFGF